MEETKETCCKEAAIEFIKKRVEDGMEIFPCLEIVTDAIKAGIAFISGLLDWLWNHHM